MSPAPAVVHTDVFTARSAAAMAHVLATAQAEAMVFALTSISMKACVQSKQIDILLLSCYKDLPKIVLPRPNMVILHTGCTCDICYCL